MKRFAACLFGLAVLVPAAVASADVAPDPCEGAEEGEACETTSGEAGTCEDSDGFLDCVKDSGDGGSSDDGCSASGANRADVLPGIAVIAGVAFAIYAMKRSRKTPAITAAKR